MATLAKRKIKSGVSYAVQFVLNGERKTISLGAKYSRRMAEEVRLYAGKTVAFIVTGEEPDRKTALWLDSMAPDLRGRFERADLIEKTESATLGELWESFIRQSEKTMKPNTVRNNEQSRKWFFAYFPEEGKLEDVNEDAAHDYKDFLLERMKPVSVTGHIKVAKTVFKYAVHRKYIAESPFKDVKKGPFQNEETRRYIPMEYVERIVDECPDQFWRTLVIMLRVGGLRCPSEIRTLKWSDVLWDKNRFYVHSPKTEGHEGHEGRMVPLFPRVREELGKLFDETEAGGSEFIFDRVIDQSEGFIRTRLKRMIISAGMEPFPKLIQNMRASCSTDLNNDISIGLVTASKWMGQSTKIACKHYWTVPDGDFDRAAGVEEPSRGDRATSENRRPQKSTAESTALFG